MIRILHEGRIVRAGLGHEDVFGEIGVKIGFGVWTSRIRCHANQQRRVIAAADSTAGGLIGSAYVECVRARGRRRLSHVEIALHPLETRRYVVLTPNLIEGDADIAVLTGIAKDVVVGGAANPVVRSAP